MKQAIILSCPTLKRELQTAIGSHAAEAAVYFLPRHLHNDPKELSRYLQDMIDSFYNVRRIVVCASRCGGGTITVLHGGFKILHKIAAGEFDEDFVTIPQGGIVPEDAFLPNR